MNSLMKKVHKTGMTRDAYVRTVLSGIQPKELPQIDFFEVLKVLRHISINMNQIAAKANASGIINADAYWENSRRLQVVIAELKDRMS